MLKIIMMRWWLQTSDVQPPKYMTCMWCGYTCIYCVMLCTPIIIIMIMEINIMENIHKRFEDRIQNIIIIICDKRKIEHLFHSVHSTSGREFCVFSWLSRWCININASVLISFFRFPPTDRTHAQRTKQLANMPIVYIRSCVFCWCKTTDYFSELNNFYFHVFSLLLISHWRV